jgi:glutamyl-tRNA synthetase
VGDYRAEGILPVAMRNFLALLGWSPGEDREILDEAELIRLFTLEAIHKKPAVFDTTKLEWMNGQYLSALPAESLVASVVAEGIDPETPNLVLLIDTVKARSRTLKQLAKQIEVRVDHQLVHPLDPKAQKLVAKWGDAYRDNLTLVIDALDALDLEQWTAENIVEVLHHVADANGLKQGDVMQPVRVALTGSTVSEPVDQLLVVVGPVKSIDRLRAAAGA